jgi:predicted transport protein
LLKLVTTFYLNKKLKQQAIYEANQKQIGYGCDIKVRKEEPQIVKQKAEKIPSFIERLENSDQKTRSYYDAIINYSEKHNIKKTIYRNKVKFFVKAKTIANLYFTHKTLRLCVALEPSSFDTDMLRFRDFSAYKKHQETPLSVLLNSKKNVENCKILIYKALNNV